MSTNTEKKAAPKKKIKKILFKETVILLQVSGMLL
jgi:hypothetical protein